MMHPSDHAELTVWLNGARVEPAQVSVNSGLNFGRYHATLPEAPARVVIALRALAWLAPAWRELALELEVDDRLDEAPSPFHALDYNPSLDHALGHPDAFAQVVAMFLERTILDHFFSAMVAPRAWTINGVTSVYVEQDSLLTSPHRKRRGFLSSRARVPASTTAACCRASPTRSLTQSQSGVVLASWPARSRQPVGTAV